MVRRIFYLTCIVSIICYLSLGPVSAAVTLSISPEYAEVDVTPGASGVMNFVVYLNNTESTMQYVDLYARIDDGEPENIVPEMSIPTGLSSEIFSVKMNAGEAVRTGAVAVGGTYGFTPLTKNNLTEVFATYYIQPYWRTLVSSAVPYVEVHGGQPHQFLVMLENNGNTGDNMSLAVAYDPQENQVSLNNNESLGQGWSFHIENPSIYLERRESEMIMVSVTPPVDAIPGLYRIPLIVSFGEGTMVEEYELYVRILPDNASKKLWTPSSIPLLAILFVYVAVSFSRKQKK